MQPLWKRAFRVIRPHRHIHNLQSNLLHSFKFTLNAISIDQQQKNNSFSFTNLNMNNYYNIKRQESTTSTTNDINSLSDIDDEESTKQNDEASPVRFEINLKCHNIYFAITFALLLLILSFRNLITTFIDEFIIGHNALNQRRSFYWNQLNIKNMKIINKQFSDHHQKNIQFLSFLVSIKSFLFNKRNHNKLSEQQILNKESNLYSLRRIMSMLIDGAMCIGIGSIIAFKARFINKMLIISMLWTFKDVLLQRFDNMQSVGKYWMDLKIISLNGNDSETWDIIKYNGLLPFYLWISNGIFYSSALSLAFLLQIKKKTKLINILYSNPIFSPFSSKQNIYHIYYGMLGCVAYKTMLQTTNPNTMQTWLDTKCNVKIIDYPK